MRRGIVAGIVLLVAAVIAVVAVRTFVASKPVVLRIGSDNEEFSSCPPVTAKRLAGQDFVFSGTLRVEGKEWAPRWVFAVDHWFSRGDADRVEIEGSDVGMSYFRQTVHWGLPEQPVPTRYLVAGSHFLEKDYSEPGLDGVASACLTRPWSPELASVYERAFAGG